MSEADSAQEVWYAHPWVVVLTGEGLRRGKYLDPQAAALAAARIRGGEAPGGVLGWTAEHLTAKRLRSVEWVPAARTLLVQRGWWRDPWRLVFADEEEGERAFHRMADLLPDAEEQEVRVGPNDLAMDPRFGLGVLLVFLGLLALIGGAVEGAGPAPMRLRILAEIGEAIGLISVLVIGAIAMIAGLAGLVWWYSNRPLKQVRQARRQATTGER